MIGLVAFLAFGILQFVEQPLPGLDVGSHAFPASLAGVNAVAVDFDRDGASDLLLPNGLWMQKDGAFPRTAMISLPDHDLHAALHIEHGRLYVYAGARLTSYSFVAHRWRPDWQASLDIEPNAHAADNPLFHDLDADGRAELILPLEETLRVFRIVPGAPAAGELSVYPPVRPRLDPVANLWSGGPLRPSGAIASREVHITLTGASLTTRETSRVTDHALERRIAVYAIRRSLDEVFSAELASNYTHPALPDVMIGCHLRKDGPIVFAGARPLAENKLRLGQTITEILLAAVPASPIAIMRTKSAPAHLALADFDADGDYDLLTQSNTLDSKSPREIVMALASARRLRHEFFVHVQETSGRFDARPRKEFSVDLDLGQPALEGGPRWDAYRRGELTCSAADFNGDGRADIVAWTTPARIDVWLNHEGVFEKKPDVTLQASEGRGLTPADVDADGKADLILLPEPGSGAPVRVLFSR